MTERRLKTNHKSEVVADEGFAGEARGVLADLGGNLRGRAS